MQAVANRTGAQPRSCDAGLWMNLLVAAFPLLVVIAFALAIYSILANATPRPRV